MVYSFTSFENKDALSSRSFAGASCSTILPVIKQKQKNCLLNRAVGGEFDLVTGIDEILGSKVRQ